jgi:hypothetical protein
MESRWKRIAACNGYWKFQFMNEPEIVHIIQTGYENLYIVVHEDGYHIQNSKNEYRTKEKIESSYGITLDF